MQLNIEEGRHPVVEAMIGEGSYVPNDLSLNEVPSHFLIFQWVS